MTLLPHLRRRPKPILARLNRAQLEARCGHLEEQRDRALGKARATRDWVTSWLEGRAAGYEQDGGTTGRAVADELRHCMRDFEEGH